MAEGGSGVNVEDSDIDDSNIEDEGVPTRRRQEMDSPSVPRSLEDSFGPSEAKVKKIEVYEAIRRGSKSNQEIAKVWILWYNADQDSALLELLQCFIHCAGCRRKLTLNVIQTDSYEEFLTQLKDEDQFNEDVNSSLSSTSGPGKKFRLKFQEFLEVLFRSNQSCVVVDSTLLQHIINITKALSHSQRRLFRYTGTLIGTKLMTTMVDTAAILHEKVVEGHGEGVDALKNDPEMRNLINELQEMLEDLFNSLFASGRRYQDIAPEIRVICISELVVWIIEYPQKFFATDKLKYIGWLLSDKVLAVKISCIKALRLLSNSAKCCPKKSQILATFMKKFKDPILEMARALDSSTVPAIKLLISISKNLQNVLTVGDCYRVQELVYVPSRTIAKAAGSFLIKNFMSASKQGGESALIRRLINFLILSKSPERLPYVVDSLIDENPLMKDWKCMTGLLLPAIDSEEVPIEDLELNMLIDLMLACLKQAATGELPEGRESVEKNEKKVAADQRALTEHFIPLMVELIDKYNDDPIKLTSLLLIPRYFQLTLQLQLPMKKGLESLLYKVSAIVDTHTDKNVLQACAQIYKVLWDSHQISKEAEQWIIELIDKYLVDAIKYRRVMQKVKENITEVRDVIECLKKLYCFYSCNNFDYGDGKLFQSVFFFVERGREWDELPEDIAHLSITVCFHILMQEMLELYYADTPSEEKIVRLQPQVKQFMDEFEFMMKFGRPNLQVQGFITICDMLGIFGRPFYNRPYLSSLLYLPSIDMKTELVSFMDRYVFVLESKYELADRRRFITAFCLLIQQNIVGVKFAAVLFKNYLSDYGGIIAQTLQKVLEIDVLGTAQYVVISLSELFTESKDANGKVDRRSPKFVAMKELAKKISPSFDLVNNLNFDQAIYDLHRDGIGFAVTPFKNPHDPAGPPPNIAFLEVLSVFSNKLTRTNKNEILKAFDRNFQKVGDGEEWFGYWTYRRSFSRRN